MKLSIVTINFNNAKNLEKTIQSVINQTSTDYEYIVIDGGSTDDSVKIIKRYNDKISYWVSEPDRGIYHAMNKGIEQAKGEYLFFLNSGDEFYNSSVLSDLQTFSLSNDFIYGDLMFIKDEKETLYKFPEKLDFKFFFSSNIGHQCLFTKRSCFALKGNYDENLKILSDWKFLATGVCLEKLTYKYIRLTIAKFYAGGISSNPENASAINLEKETIYKECFPAFYEYYHYSDQLKLLKYSRLFKLIQKIGFFKYIKL